MDGTKMRIDHDGYHEVYCNDELVLHCYDFNIDEGWVRFWQSQDGHVLTEADDEGVYYPISDIAYGIITLKKISFDSMPEDKCNEDMQELSISGVENI